MNQTSSFTRLPMTIAKAATAAIFSLIPLASHAQADYTATVTYKHNRFIGQDALVWQTNNGASNCTPSGMALPPSISNFGDSPQGSMMAWTWLAAGCATGRTRFFIRFPQLSLLAGNVVPVGDVTINSAILTLHGIPESGIGGSYGNSYFTGSPYPYPNDGRLWKVAPGLANAWREENITWNNSQSLVMDALPAVPVPVTGSRYGGTQTLDVTAMVARIVRDAAGYFNGTTWVAPEPLANNGFMLQLSEEVYYRAQFFATSDYSDPALWPELTVTYSVDSRCATLTDAGFSYTTDPGNALAFTFRANSPTFGVGYRWFVVPSGTPLDYTGTPTGIGPVFSYTFPAQGQYKVAMATFCSQDIIANIMSLLVTTSGTYPYPQSATKVTGNPVRVSDEDNGNRILPGDWPSTTVLAESNISVSPNPATDRWTVSLSTAMATPVQITLYDASGRKVMEDNRDLQIGSNRFDIPAQHLPAGLYMLNIRGGSLNRQQKLIRE